MASKKNLKKKINRFIIEDVIDECIYLEEVNPSLEDKCDKIIDEAVDFYNDMMSRIGASKVKKDFTSIMEEFDSKIEYFTASLNKLNETK